MTKYYQIIGEPHIAFNSIDEALEYDMQFNPEYHGTKESSFHRYENAIIDADWDELNNTQQNSLCNDSILDDNGYDRS